MMNTISCESFIDYTYGDYEIAQEGLLSSLKNQLRKLCGFLYKKCMNVYRKTQQKHPKIASIFKGLADFFKKHSNLVEHCTKEEELENEKEAINNKVNETYRQLYHQKLESTHTFYRTVKNTLDTLRYMMTADEEEKIEDILLSYLKEYKQFSSIEPRFEGDANRIEEQSQKLFKRIDELDTQLKYAVSQLEVIAQKADMRK